MDALKLPNVTVPEYDGPEEKLSISTTIRSVIWELASANPLMPVPISLSVWELASANPLWQFKAVWVHGYDGGAVLTHFAVWDGTEQLGTITRSRTRNGKAGIGVTNSRIEQAMSRDATYRTEDPKKAIAKVKKMFSAKSVVERVEEADKKATEVGRHESHKKRREVNEHDAQIRNAGIRFLATDEGSSAFVDYLQAQNTPEANATLHSMEERETVFGELTVMSTLMDAMEQANKSVLVIVNGGKYLVKSGTETQVYDDNTLPVEWRGKLGILKLVNSKQFVSEMGLRVDDGVFILLA